MLCTTNLLEVAMNHTCCKKSDIQPFDEYEFSIVLVFGKETKALEVKFSSHSDVVTSFEYWHARNTSTIRYKILAE